MVGQQRAAGQVQARRRRGRHRRGVRRSARGRPGSAAPPRPRRRPAAGTARRPASDCVAARAAVPEGEQVSADPAAPGPACRADVEPAHGAGSEVARARARAPRRRCRSPGTGSVEPRRAGRTTGMTASAAVRPGAAASSHLDAGDLRGGRLDRALDGQLQGDRRGRAAVAAAQQPQPDRPVVGDPEQLDVAAVRAEVGPDARPAPARPGCRRRTGAGRAPAAGWPPGRRRPAREHLVVEPARVVQDLQHPLEAGAVEVGDQPDQLLGPLPRHRAARRAGVEQRVDPLPGGAQVSRSSGGPARPLTDAVIRLSRSRTGWASAAARASCPSPRYMCTPHGRQGSKLRTVRMMSMPLKCSRSFSSKIGWPCTASS